MFNKTNTHIFYISAIFHYGSSKKHIVPLALLYPIPSIFPLIIKEFKWVTYCPMLLLNVQVLTSYFDLRQRIHKAQKGDSKAIK